MSTAERPNIVFVFSDQQRYSALGVNGNDVIRTPVLDAMAAEGLVCEICIPIIRSARLIEQFC